jgi:hypothetical protein
MNIIQRYQNVNPKIRTVVFIIMLIVIGLLVGKLVGMISSPILLENIEGQRGPHIPPPSFELSDDQKQAIITGYTNVSMILCVEISLLLGIIYVFIQTYMKTHSRYLIGFILFVGVFFVKSVTYLLAMTPLITDPIRQAPMAINPLIQGFFGPFGIYFTFFEIIAICILIYLSRE